MFFKFEEFGGNLVLSEESVLESIHHVKFYFFLSIAVYIPSLSNNFNRKNY